jgi:transposase
MRPHGSALELEKRRRLAVARVNEGYSRSKVARFLGVNYRTVRQWCKCYRDLGEEGLTHKPHPGRTPKLKPWQERLVLTWFRKNPTSFGFATELWTAPRVAQVIERKWGVKFHPRYLNHWLTQRGITPQKPERRPRERNQAEIDRWLTVEWPRIQNRRAAGGRIWSCSTKAAF